MSTNPSTDGYVLRDTDMENVSSEVAVCLSKVPYRSRGDAQKALRAITTGRRIRGKAASLGKVEVYLCNVCEKHHHGHWQRDNRRPAVRDEE